MSPRPSVPTTSMIFVLADDLSLLPVGDLAEARRECEIPDVANGIYRFFDYRGSSLYPYLVSRPPTAWLDRLLRSGPATDFVLHPTNDPLRPDLQSQLGHVVTLESNRYFGSLADVASYLSQIPG